jgi:hypothetical protein
VMVFSGLFQEQFIDQVQAIYSTVYSIIYVASPSSSSSLALTAHQVQVVGYLHDWSPYSLTADTSGVSRYVLHSAALCCMCCMYCTALYYMYCTALHCTAMHCAVLHCTAMFCTALTKGLPAAAIAVGRVPRLHSAAFCTGIEWIGVRRLNRSNTSP